MKMKPLLKVNNLQKYFPVRKNNFFGIGTDYVKANKDISLDIFQGETLGIVGESGCGKSTFGRTIIQLHKQTGGSTLYYGETIENFVPKYVKDVFKNLPKTGSSYESDLEEIERLEKELNRLGTVDNQSVEELQEKQHAFEDKYGNTLRLVGGLVVHPDQNKVSKTLVDYYDSLSHLAKKRRQLEMEATKQEMKKKTNEKLLNDLREKVQTKEAEVESKKVNIEELKAEAAKNDKFDRYEGFLDQGIDLASLTAEENRLLRKDLQIIFQNPYSSLDPKLTVGEIIGEGLLIHGFFESKKDPAYVEYITDIMEKCGLKAEFFNRYPHQFSGGQRQRIGIARALAVKPKFVVADEAVSALDVSIQSQIINLLIDLREEDDLTYLFITHDLSVVRYISDRIGVMYFGRLVEIAEAKELYENPIHPYTKRLLNAIPTMDQATKDYYDVDEEYEDFFFNYDKEDTHDPDWVEVSDGHFVATTLKNRSERKAVKGALIWVY